MTTKGLSGVKVRDSLILVAANRFQGDQPVTVSRIGTKFLYVSSNGRERREQFDRTTGIEVRQRGIPARLLTQEQYDEQARRRALFASLFAQGIDVREHKRAGMSTVKLQALLAVVEGEEAPAAPETPAPPAAAPAPAGLVITSSAYPCRTKPHRGRHVHASAYRMGTTALNTACGKQQDEETVDHLDEDAPITCPPCQRNIQE
ncbi:hypothetical protein [Streptomyces lydicus]|uniref:beta barrel domain-containing protein n=1 Tax=Streptomyces lydicus TaxID=47763 RepID=UPI0010101F18|nr:hypothetical protein [Streptomyces lydicus]MCZ1012304.1 hypothetical protein [Streptomyces lydicus]